MQQHICSLGGNLQLAEIQFTEYDLSNGLHVILHQDDSLPVVVTSIMYHVGAKDDPKGRSGFAHFFEHLLFEGTVNIPRGEWFKLVTANGGSNNANTSDDRTYYYEVFPANQLELALWMEADRLKHPVINQIGVDTQKEVVKEEKRMRYDNRPYGMLLAEVKKHLFAQHPYQNTTIGEMEHIDASTLEEFQDFNKKYYIPNNAVLVVAGNFEIEQAKSWIDTYFGSIPKGSEIARIPIAEKPITQTIHATYEDNNIQIPMLVLAYRTPSMKNHEARVLDLISAYLSDGKSAKLYKKMVDEKKIALQMGAFNHSQEDYGMYIMYGIPMSGVSLEDLKKEIDAEIFKLQNELISETDFQKLKNKQANHMVDSRASLENIAHDLATFYLLHHEVNLINTEAQHYDTITREDIQQIAQTYLKTEQRLELAYNPKTQN